MRLKCDGCGLEMFIESRSEVTDLIALTYRCKNKNCPTVLSATAFSCEEILCCKKPIVSFAKSKYKVSDGVLGRRVDGDKLVVICPVCNLERIFDCGGAIEY